MCMCIVYDVYVFSSRLRFVIIHPIGQYVLFVAQTNMIIEMCAQIKGV